MGRIIRVTDEVIDYRKWIKETFPLTVNEMDSLSSSTGSDASTLSAPASDTVYKIWNLSRKIFDNLFNMNNFYSTFGIFLPIGF